MFGLDGWIDVFFAGVLFQYCCPALIEAERNLS